MTTPRTQLSVIFVTFLALFALIGTGCNKRRVVAGGVNLTPNITPPPANDNTVDPDPVLGPLPTCQLRFAGATSVPSGTMTLGLVELGNEAPIKSASISISGQPGTEVAFPQVGNQVFTVAPVVSTLYRVKVVGEDDQEGFCEASLAVSGPAPSICNINPQACLGQINIMPQPR